MSIPNFADLNRREVVAGVAVSVAASALPAPAWSAAVQTGDRSLSTVSLSINGDARRLELDPRVTLLDALREHMHLTGTKKGCDHGHCGACTVLVNGTRINACLSLAVMHEGDAVTTVEGLGRPGALHPMQAAFLEHDAFQCGYCTPGQICSAVALQDEIRKGVPSHVTGDLTAAMTLSNAELRERMSGNICRCGAYSNIAEAVAATAGSAP